MPKPKMKDGVKITLFLDRRLLDVLGAMSQAQGRSRSSMIEQLIQQSSPDLEKAREADLTQEIRRIQAARASKRRGRPSA